MELITKEAVLSKATDQGWNVYYSIDFPKINKLHDEVIPDFNYDEVYFLYGEIPIVYRVSPKIVLVPKPYYLNDEDFNAIRSNDITVDSWEMILLEKSTSKFSISKNRAMMAPYTSCLHKDINIIPGSYKLKSDLASFDEHIEITKRTNPYVFSRAFIVGHNCLTQEIYPKSRNVNYLYSIIYSVIYLKTKNK